MLGSYLVYRRYVPGTITWQSLEPDNPGRGSLSLVSKPPSARQPVQELDN